MQELTQIRRRWSDMTNEALREAGIQARVSHVPDEEAILRPEARPWLPRVAWEIEKRGGHSVLGDRVREQFGQLREPVQSEVRRSPEEIRAQAIQQWRAIRAGVTARPENEVERQMDSLRRELGRDDFGL